MLNCYMGPQFSITPELSVLSSAVKPVSLRISMEEFSIHIVVNFHILECGDVGMELRPFEIAIRFVQVCFSKSVFHFQ